MQTPIKSYLEDFRRGGIEIIFKEYSEKLKIELTPRSLRQACIFNWLKDKNEESIKEWMGVAPSYCLKQFKEHLPKHIYSDFSLKKMKLLFRPGSFLNF